MEGSQAMNQFSDMTQFSDTESPEWTSDQVLVTKDQMVLMLIFLAFFPEEPTAFYKVDHTLR